MRGISLYCHCNEGCSPYPEVEQRADSNERSGFYKPEESCKDQTSKSASQRAFDCPACSRPSCSADFRTDDKGYQTVFNAADESSAVNENARQSAEAPKAKEKKKFDFVTLVSIASIVATVIMFFSKLPNDILYYGISFLSIAATFLSVASLVKAHNLSCSRAIPHFFDKRQGA